MPRTKNSIIVLLFSIVILHCISCSKNRQNNTVKYEDRVAQDTAYRIGKWYSIMPWTNQSINPDLDTIWFVNDTLAGWSAFVLDSPYAYSFRKTYFPDPYHIAIISPGGSSQTPGTIDTTINECGMTATGDTFAIYWRNSYLITEQLYVKKTN